MERVVQFTVNGNRTEPVVAMTETIKHRLKVHKEAAYLLQMAYMREPRPTTSMTLNIPGDRNEDNFVTCVLWGIKLSKDNSCARKPGTFVPVGTTKRKRADSEC
ncbi:g7781 [Coccomyxa elongata]